MKCLWLMLSLTNLAMVVTGVAGRRGGVWEVPLSEMSEYDHGVVNFALSQLEAGSNNMYARKVVRIAKFQKQVVAGTRYIMTLELGETSCEKTSEPTLCAAPETATETCTVSVWDKPWENFRQLIDDDVQCNRKVADFSSTDVAVAPQVELHFHLNSTTKESGTDYYEMPRDYEMPPGQDYNFVGGTWQDSSTGITRIWYKNLDEMGQTTWGDWTTIINCPEYGKVDGFRLRMGDDTVALNSIELNCVNGGVINPHKGYWGEWTQYQKCSQGTYITGAMLKSEPGQGWWGDDSAANNLKIKCSDGLEKHDPLTGWKGGHSGSWGSWGSCADTGGYICGLMVRMETQSWWQSDHTALNQVRFSCCREETTLPSPTTTTATATTTTSPTTTSPTTTSPTTTSPTTTSPTTTSPTTTSPTTTSPTTTTATTTTSPTTTTTTSPITTSPTTTTTTQSGPEDPCQKAMKLFLSKLDQLPDTAVSLLMQQLNEEEKRELMSGQDLSTGLLEKLKIMIKSYMAIDSGLMKLFNGDETKDIMKCFGG